MTSFNLSEWALAHRSFVVFMMIVAVAAGAFSYFRLGRGEDPPFVIKTMIVHAAWPGATVTDTLKQVTERLERKLQETPHVDIIRSITTAGETTIFVDLKEATPPREVPDVWYDVRKSIGDIRHTLPAGVVGPAFNDDFGDTFGIIYGFTADGFTHRELRDRVEAARSRVLHVHDVSKVDIIGAQDEKIFVEFSVKEFATLGIDRSALITALQTQNVVRPAGVIQTGDESLSLQVSGSFATEQDILDVNFVVGRRTLRLGDIAKVRRGHADPPQPLFRVNGKPAIGLAISMRDGGDILALGKNVNRTMQKIIADLPIGIEATLVADQAVTVDGAISEFMKSLFQAIGIILVTSFIALGLRPGLIIALCIPLTLAIVFPVMQAAAIDMQRISLGALIIALALMVDDAMTITDATLTRLAAGDAKVKAATFAFKAYAFAMLAGTLVTIAGFIPVGFAASSAGEYTFSLFAVVAIALIASWFVAVIFAPLLCVTILTPPKTVKAEPGRIYRIYRAFLTFAMRAKWLTLALTLVLFVASILGMSLIPRQFFPSSDRPELMVDLTLPQNASIFASQSVARRFDEVLAKDKDIARWSTYVGTGAIRFYLPLDVQGPNTFIAQAVIVAKNAAVRDPLRARLEKVLAEQFPNVVARVSPLELGPPVGWPVQYRVSGPDIPQVRELAFKLSRVIAANAKITEVGFDWIEPSRQLRIRIDQDEARILGLSTQAVASALNTVISGSAITQVRDDIYLVEVVTRATDEQRISIAGLRTLQIPVPSGRTVSLSQFATFEYEQDYPVIWRRDRIPTLTVLADIVPGELPNTVVESLTPAVEALAGKLPSGYTIEIAGSVEQSADSLASVIAVVPAMLIIMLTVLMIEVQSFQRLIIVLSVAPLGLIGVVGALLASGRPLGFVAILGVLALIGMITKNAVILIGQIESERAQGKDVWQAAIDASSTRFRPIMLTALSTVLGLIPIAPTVFWGPMAFAIMGGLMVGTILTLVFLPVLYVAWFGGKESAGERPKAEESAV